MHLRHIFYQFRVHRVRKVMNRNFPTPKYLDTIGLKHLVRPSDPSRLTKTQAAIPTDTPPRLHDDLHPPSCCFPWTELKPTQTDSCPEVRRLLPKATGLLP